VPSAGPLFESCSLQRRVGRTSNEGGLPSAGVGSSAQVAWRHLENPESKGRARSPEVGDLLVQRGAKVLAGDKLPFIHLTELDIVKVGMCGGSNAGPVVTARNAAFWGGVATENQIRAGADADRRLRRGQAHGTFGNGSIEEPERSLEVLVQEMHRVYRTIWLTPEKGRRFEGSRTRW